MLTNKATFTTADLMAVFGRDSLFNIDNTFTCTGVSTDTRTLEKGNIFVALVGEISDGHARIAEAYEKGASAVILNKELARDDNIYGGKPYISVRDTLIALGKLASFHRGRFEMPILVIGGSNGKTTTKEITAHVLSTKFNVLKTHANFNNRIGVPMMLFQLDGTQDMAVLEIGTNEPGEIATLCGIADPDNGLITNIGKEHLEKLIDLDGVELEETFLFGHLYKKGGTAFINMDDPRLARYEQLVEKKVTYATNADATIKANITLDEMLKPSIELNWADNSVIINMKTQGYTTALNALAAAAAGIYFGLDKDELKQSLESFENPAGNGYARMLVEKAGNITIINDCYNANPDSMKAALVSLRQIRSGGKKYAVLGDMRELGEAAQAEHQDIQREALASADEILITGDEMGKAANAIGGSSKLTYFDSKDALAGYLTARLVDNDVVLVKGSRGMKMEEIIRIIKEAE